MISHPLVRKILNQIAKISLTNWIALGAAFVAVVGIVYQHLQIERIDHGLKLAQEAQKITSESQARELVARATELLGASVGGQAELRYLGDPLDPFIESQHWTATSGCALSAQDRSILNRIGNLLANAMELDPNVVGAIEMALRISQLLNDDRLIERIERTAMRSQLVEVRIQALLAAHAARFDKDKVLELVGVLGIQDKIPDAVTVQAAIALRRVGEYERAIELLSKALQSFTAGLPVAYALARAKLDKSLTERAEIDEVLKITERYGPMEEYLRPHFQLIKINALRIKGDFDRSNSLLRELRERLRYSGTILPYPWAHDALRNEPLPPQSTLDELDNILAACPVAALWIHRERALALGSLGRCEEATVAMAKGYSTGSSRELFNALASPPAKRKFLLESAEASLGEPQRSGKSTDLLELDRAIIAALLWSTNEHRKSVRALVIAKGIEYWIKSLNEMGYPDRTPPDGRAEAELYISELNSFLGVLRDYSRAKQDPKRKELAGRADSMLQKYSALSLEGSKCALEMAPTLPLLGIF